MVRQMAPPYEIKLLNLVLIARSLALMHVVVFKTFGKMWSGPVKFGPPCSLASYLLCCICETLMMMMMMMMNEVPLAWHKVRRLQGHETEWDTPCKDT